MYDVKCWDHVIDFFVILFADLIAAYIVIKIFESHDADRKRTKESLSKLYQIATRLQNFYGASRRPTHDFLIRRLNNDLRATQNEHEFENIRDDYLFWNFKIVVPFRTSYNKISIQKELVLKPQSTEELQINIDDLLKVIGSLKSEIENELSKKPWWKIRF